MGLASVCRRRLTCRHLFFFDSPFLFLSSPSTFPSSSSTSRCSHLLCNLSLVCATCFLLCNFADAIVQLNLQKVARSLDCRSLVVWLINWSKVCPSLSLSRSVSLCLSVCHWDKDITLHLSYHQSTGSPHMYSVFFCSFSNFFLL